MKPSYQKFSPTWGEWIWTGSPTDTLLSYQFAYLQYLSTHWKSHLLDFRQGFTRLSLVWEFPLDQERFIEAIANLELSPVPLPSKVWQVPVCYAPEFGTDSAQLAQEKGISQAQLIALHTTPLYRIHFYGFLPGFFYLNGLDPLLHSPRKSIPSASVSPGSVAIGGSQTGIYPKQSPGGWHVLGKTPLTLFERKQQPPVWAEPGDRIQFVAIHREQYEQLEQKKPEFVLL